MTPRHLTDLGNAERLVAFHGDDLRFCHLWATWLCWDGRRWAKDESGETERRAKATVRALYGEAANTDDPDARKALALHARRSEAESRIRAMVTLARSEPGIPVLPSDLDADPWVLNVSNGTLDLRTGELRPHRRTDLLSKLAPVPFEANAECPTWVGFLKRVLDDRDSLIGFVQRAVGYSLTGDVMARKLFILHGSGRNGKSTFLRTIGEVLGDYSMRTPSSSLMDRRGDSIPNDLARLKGARFVATTETAEGKRLAEAQVKDITGGEPITARFMRAEWFEFMPEFKLWLATNHLPDIRGTDPAIWDRVRRVPFEVRIPEDEEDTELPDKLRVEFPGILRWAVEGCLAWQVEGLAEPEEVQGATSSWRRDMDVLGAFLSDMCEEGPELSEAGGPLYVAYHNWCERNGYAAKANNLFALALRERGFSQKRTNRGQSWQSLALVKGPRNHAGVRRLPLPETRGRHRDHGPV